jgi:hypothetical protein
MLTTIIKAAENKFGTVVHVIAADAKSYRLAIKRTDCPLPKSAPYMTIRAVQNDSGVVDFAFGSYDLTNQAMLNQMCGETERLYRAESNPRNKQA